MAERGEEGPFFYKGFFNHRSVRSDQLTREQRIEYRGIYRKLYKKSDKTYKGRMKARAMVRTMLYSEVPKR